jgi:16S rRNA (uracil1498-N3)-methyltransferase
LARTEPGLALTLYQSVLKGDRFEWVLQKGTELGAAAFVPMLSRRAIVTDAARVSKKRPRWERIIREAAEQSRRGRLPRLADPVSFSQACRESVETHDLVLIPWEKAAHDGLSGMLRSLVSRPASIALLIGPEGGFEHDEIALAQRGGIRTVTLGPRTLRAETAGLAAMTIVLSELGEMGK